MEITCLDIQVYVKSALKYDHIDHVLLKQQIGSAHLIGQRCNRHTIVREVSHEYSICYSGHK